MKKIFLLGLLLVVNFVFCQTKSVIDSLNNIPIAIKQEKASLLDKVFLQNAKNALKINYILGEAESYSNLSFVYYYQGHYDKDLKYALKAIAIYEKLNNQEKLALEYGELGYRMKKQNLDKAIFYMQKGKTIAEKRNFQKPLLSIYNNYGYLKELKIENDSALYFYKKGLDLKVKINDSIGIPYSLNNIALIYIKQKKFSEAEILFEKALKIRLQLNDKIGVAENYFYKGELNYYQNKFSVALLFYRKSLEIALKNKYLNLEANCYEAIANCYEKSGNANQSLFNYKKFIQCKDSLFNIETNSKIAELEIQFNTAKKQKQIIQQQAEAQEKNLYLTGISVFAILIGLIGYLIYRQQKQKNRQQKQEFKLNSAFEKIENKNKLQEQRLSISRDLHDNIGSQLTFIISSVDNIKYGFNIDNPKLDNKLSNISSFAKDTILELRDTIWAMNSNEISFEDLEIRINNFIEKAKISQENISFSFAIDEQLKTKKLSSIEGMNIYRTIQEALNNALKYANASVISINIKQEKNTTVIVIKDNGNGFDSEGKIASELAMTGNGLKNMQKRIEEIGGTFGLTSDENGTKIIVII